jgi:hypothetical protein
LLLLVLASLCQPLAAQDKWETAADCQKRLKSAVKCFAHHARTSYAACKLTWNVALMRGEMMGEASACLQSSAEAMRPHYQAARKRLSNNKAGASTLEEAYASWQDGMHGLIPSGTRREYERRIEAAGAQIDKLLRRLETGQ